MKRAILAVAVSLVLAGTSRADTFHLAYDKAATYGEPTTGIVVHLHGCRQLNFPSSWMDGWRNLLVENDDDLREVLRHGTRRIAVHAEDEPRLIERKKIAEERGDVHAHPDWRDGETAIRATKRLLRLVGETGRKVHRICPLMCRNSVATSTLFPDTSCSAQPASESCGASMHCSTTCLPTRGVAP